MKVLNYIKGLFATLGILLFTSMTGKNTSSVPSEMIAKNFYDHYVMAINEQDTVRMSDFKGKKVLIVNVASECGYTYQYEGLEKLHEEYGDKVAIIGVPCNQFGAQEPGSNEQVDSFCRSNYGVKFTMTSKVDVRGENQHPLYTWLTRKDLNDKEDYKITWNFNKFLISETGELLAHFNHKVEPMSDEVLQYLKD